MSEKFFIEEVEKHFEWDEFTSKSPQYTMFVSSNYLSSFGGKFRLFFVKKGIHIKAAFCLLLSDDEKKVVLDDLVIYSGILFKKDLTQKEVKARSERFEITELVINYITNIYINIEMALPVSFDDMRPFLWHNYGSSNKKEIFTLDLRYTSYLDISELILCDNDENTQLFKNCDTLRQRHIRKAKKEKAYTVEELDIENYLYYYKELMLNQGEVVNPQKLDNMKNIIINTIKAGQASMLVTKNSENQILYITVFSFDQSRAYYLFGAGNPVAVEKYKGTICFWHGFKILAQKYCIKEVDLEGVNSPNRGWFKLSFGGKLLPYYEVFKG